MKILTKDEEKQHFRATWQGGLLGGAAGLAVGGAGIYAASIRYPAFRSLSVPFRAFLLTSTGTFAAVVTADRFSRQFEKSRHGDADYENTAEADEKTLSAQQPLTTRFKTFVSENRYPIVFGSWVAGMAISLGIVGRHPTLTAQQKLVQARVYAQGLTLAVLVASFMLEGNDLRAGKGRWETVRVVDPDDPEHKRVIEKKIHHESYQGEDQWMDMIEGEEKRMKERGHSVRTRSKDAQKQQGGQQQSQSKEQSQDKDQSQSKEQSGGQSENKESGEAKAKQ